MTTDTEKIKPDLLAIGKPSAKEDWTTAQPLSLSGESPQDESQGPSSALLDQAAGEASASHTGETQDDAAIVDGLGGAAVDHAIELPSTEGLPPVQ